VRCTLTINQFVAHCGTEFAALEQFQSGQVATTLTATAAQIGEIHGVETLRLQADLTQVEQVERIMQETMDKWGRIDILVNNAGGDIAAEYGKPDPNDGVFIKDEDVRAVLDRNLYSCILCCQHAGRSMIAGGDGGRIINLSSVVRIH
jgi:3-oxoacyl-[acyl-carrier protein] reductase